MADPTFHTPDPAGRPVWGGYLESEEEAGPSISDQYHQPAPRQKSTHPPKGWNGDLDTYDLQNPLYDPNAWYVATHAADKRVKRVNLSVPQFLYDVVSQMMATGCFPALREHNDFIRDAVVHAIYKRIAEIRDPEFRVQLTGQIQLAAMQAIAAEHEARREFVAIATQELADCMGCPSMTREVMEKVWAAMDSGQFDGLLFRRLEDLTVKYGFTRGQTLRPVDSAG